MKVAKFGNITKLKRLRMLQDSLGPFRRVISSDDCRTEQILLWELPAPCGGSSKNAAQECITHGRVGLRIIQQQLSP